MLALPLFFLTTACIVSDARDSAKDLPGLSPSDTANLAKVAEAQLEGRWQGLFELYRDLHSHPEISNEEVRTAGVLSERLRQLGMDVEEKVGGTGVVGVLRNGAGPTVLIRTDMDALPVTEKTGLPYESKVQVRRPDGQIVGVMHACGHDVHMTCWIGVAEALSRMKDRWSGTLVFIGQPAEEVGMGAKQMLDAGLFERFPKPDVGLALHCEPFTPHGMIGYVEGYALANVDSVDIVVHGRGGHGASPHTAIDPVVIAAQMVVNLQTLVSRELDPLDAGVVTVGSIHGGTKHNIIPSEVKLQLTVRSFKDGTRKRLLDGIDRIARASSQGAGAPPPTVTIDSHFTPATFNDPKLVRATVESLKATLGADRLEALDPVMGGEDFSRYGLAGVPCFIMRLGTIDADQVEAHRLGKSPLPSLHSEGYAPNGEASIRTGVKSLSAAVLRIVGSKP